MRFTAVSMLVAAAVGGLAAAVSVGRDFDPVVLEALRSA